MGQACSGNAPTEPEETQHDNTPLNLGKIHIWDFERRVKMFAHPVNKGRVTVDQLYKAFEDTAIFENLRNPFSLVHKLLLSPFFRELPLTHYNRVDTQIARDAYVLSDAGYASNRHVKQPSTDIYGIAGQRQSTYKMRAVNGSVSGISSVRQSMQIPPDQLDIFSF